MDTSFLGLDFTPVDLEQRGPLGSILARHPQPLSDYNFAALVAWAPVFRCHYHIVGADTLLLTCAVGPDGQRRLFQPVGDFPAGLQEELLARARELPYPLRIHGVCEEFLSAYPAFVARFEVAANRDSANYVYATEDLAELAGRKLTKKRNHIAQVTRLYPWTAEALTPEHVEECLAVADDIATKRCAETGGTLEQETQALEHALRLFGPLRLRGLLLRVAGRPAAFSIFDQLTPTTAVVLFERALRSLNGMYQVINRETAREIARLGLAFINREEDLGDPGLRQAKLSYHPTRLEMAYTLTLRR
jgi:hypothetical protein